MIIETGTCVLAAHWCTNLALTSYHLDTLEKHFSNGAVVNEESLRKIGLVNGRFDGVKILGRGEITKSLTLVVDEISAIAREKIEKAGGSVSIPKVESAS